VHEYVKMEANLKRTLTVLEYDSAFLTWASKMLQEDVFKMLAAGQSVASALRTKISKSLQQSRKLGVANRRRNADRYGFEFKEHWDAEEVTVTARGEISLHLSEERRALKILVPSKARKQCLSAQAKNEKTVISFIKAGVELKLGEDLIVTLSIDDLQKQKRFGQEGVDQHHKELARKGELKRKENGEV
jgi:acyl-CoA thioesterase FadM